MGNGSQVDSIYLSWVRYPLWIQELIIQLVKSGNYPNGVSDLKKIKFGVIALLLFGIVFVLPGIVCADQVVNATPETQSISTLTNVDAVGITMETDAVVWTLMNGPSGPSQLFTYTWSPGGEGQPIDWYDLDQIISDLGTSNVMIGKGRIIQLIITDSMLNKPFPGSLDPGSAGTYQAAGEQLTADGPTSVSSGGSASRGIHSGVLDPGQVQYSTTYDANIVAQAGHTVFIKSMNIHTGNKVIGKSNLNAQTILTYAATSDGGNVAGSENLLLDGAGMPTPASDRMLCPFGSASTSTIPAFCNIVEAGSSLDMTEVSVASEASLQTTAASADIPVALSYHIKAQGFNGYPAQGSISAYIKANIQEGRGGGVDKAEDLAFSETTTASGEITLFDKLIGYNSGMRRNA